MISARERARQAAATFREREKKLEDLAVSFFAAADQVEKVHAQRDRDVQAVIEKADRQVGEFVAEGDRAIAAMLSLGVAQSEVRERLGCSAADVRRAMNASMPIGDDFASAETPADPAPEA